MVVVAGRVGLVQSCVDIALHAIVGAETAHIVHRSDVTVYVVHGHGILFGMVAGDLGKLEGSLVSNALWHLGAGEQGLEA